MIDQREGRDGGCWFAVGYNETINVSSFLYLFPRLSARAASDTKVLLARSLRATFRVSRACRSNLFSRTFVKLSTVVCQLVVASYHTQTAPGDGEAIVKQQQFKRL